MCMCTLSLTFTPKHVTDILHKVSRTDTHLGGHRLSTRTSIHTRTPKSHPHTLLPPVEHLLTPRPGPSTVQCSGPSSSVPNTAGHCGDRCLCLSPLGVYESRRGHVLVFRCCMKCRSPLSDFGLKQALSGLHPRNFLMTDR